MSDERRAVLPDAGVLWGSKWSPREDSIINTLAPLGMAELRRQLPGRSSNAIRARATRLGVAIKKTNVNKEWMRGRLPIPPRAHPLVKRFVQEANRQGAFLHEIAGRAGISRQSISKWRYSVNPHFGNFIAALNVLGLDLAIVPRREDRA